MPEWAMNCYVRMLPQLMAERVQERMNSLLATNDRAFSNKDRRSYLRSLEQPDAARRRRAPKVSPEFLARAAIRIKQGEEVKT